MMDFSDQFNLIDQEQLASQLLGVMEAHFQRPTPEQQIKILRLAEQQIMAASALSRGREVSCAG